MIKSIHIEDISYFSKSSEEMSGLSKINFVYGTNGSGKTTISRVIADDCEFPSCTVKWESDHRLETFVYNSDFVKENFGREEIKGIFTLGKDDIGIKEKISSTLAEIETLNEEIAGLKYELEGEDGIDGKKTELEKLEEEFKDRCWEAKTGHDEYFERAFTGYRGKKEKFRDKVLEESESKAAGAETLDYLKQKAKKIFKDDLSPLEAIQAIRKDDKDDILGHEANPILGKKIVGREDVDVADMIRSLGNSDWVKSGRVYFEKNDEEVCPFCQQKTPEEFAKSLNEYFDETFEKDMDAVGKLDDSYEADSKRLLEQIRSTADAAPEVLDVDTMKSKEDILRRILEGNAEWIKTKKAEPSREIALETAADVIAEIEALVKTANSSIKEHNGLVRRIGQEKTELTGQVWKYIVNEELKDVIKRYRKDKSELKRSIEKIEHDIRSMSRNRDGKKQEIKNLEKERTSVQRTVDEINFLLSSVGFTSFSLARDDGGNFYRVARDGGENAKETLSEGEERFVTFLYFYHLLKGSQSSDGVAPDCVVVFDDPVSSLDGEMLFVISNLIKGVFKEIRKGKGNIKQAFVLTHNVYFHKEITYKYRKNESTFWIVRKSKPQGKKLKKSKSNPIKTSYELLWVDIRNDESPCSGTLQNTMRRILEYYFQLLGEVDKDDICGKFDEDRKTICDSLFSWANAGSHHVDEGLYVSMGHSDELYREVFREIFEKTGHIAHYDMMMGKSSS